MPVGGLSFDPMFAWYAHHYGRGAAQAQAQAQAQQAADDMQAEVISSDLCIGMSGVEGRICMCLMA